MFVSQIWLSCLRHTLICFFLFLVDETPSSNLLILQTDQHSGVWGAEAVFVSSSCCRTAGEHYQGQMHVSQGEEEETQTGNDTTVSFSINVSDGIQCELAVFKHFVFSFRRNIRTSTLAASPPPRARHSFLQINQRSNHQCWLV